MDELDPFTGCAPLPHVYCVADDSARAQHSLAELHTLYDFARSTKEAEIIVALGGDGFMLDVMHRFIHNGPAIYGMNCGTVGFLMNNYRAGGLGTALEKSRKIVLNPLRMDVTTLHGSVHSALAINEVSLLRETRQTARIRITIDGKIRMAELVGDGLLVCTPAGSTAYNLSANGTIIPLGSQMLGLTPVSPFRPRRWRGALLPSKVKITLDALHSDKRPVSAVADFTEIRHASTVNIANAEDISITLLFDKGHSLEERIFNEQFIH